MKKIIASVLALTMTAAMFTACGDASSSSSKADSQAETTTTTAAASESAAESNSERQQHLMLPRCPGMMQTQQSPSSR